MSEWHASMPPFMEPPQESLLNGYSSVVYAMCVCVCVFCSKRFNCSVFLPIGENLHYFPTYALSFDATNRMYALFSKNRKWTDAQLHAWMAEVAKDSVRRLFVPCFVVRLLIGALRRRLTL